MLFFCFLERAKCESLHLTENNWDSIVNNPQGTPVFLKAWATWCPHCKAMAPVWDELSNESKYEGKVIFADIECDYNRKLCEKLPGENTPRIYWIEPARNGAMIKYQSERALSVFENFIDKQFSFPLALINEDEIDEQLKKAGLIPTFLFRISPTDTKSLNIAKEALDKERDSTSMFLLVNGEEGSEPSLMVYSGSKNVTFSYKGEWNAEKIKDFVIVKTIRYMRRTDAYVIRHADNHKRKVFIIVQNNEEELSEELKEKALTASDRYIVSLTDCNESDWFCRYTDIHPIDKDPVIVIYSRYERLFWVYEKGTDFNEWLSDVYDEKIKGDGPGTGWFNVFKKAFFDARAEGKSPPYVLFVIPFIFIGMVAYMVYDSRKMNDIKNKRE